mmetsp:Transcript_63259/g.193516  ORF Transcript_63259/g.193516 Transcript_63259/m.193516 type:complete len:225 (+) Transcript_63259:1299-1973(+)
MRSVSRRWTAAAAACAAARTPATTPRVITGSRARRVSSSAWPSARASRLAGASSTARRGGARCGRATSRPPRRLTATRASRARAATAKANLMPRRTLRRGPSQMRPAERPEATLAAALTKGTTPPSISTWSTASLPLTRARKGAGSTAGATVWNTVGSVASSGFGLGASAPPNRSRASRASRTSVRSRSSSRYSAMCSGIRSWRRRSFRRAPPCAKWSFSRPGA